MIKTIAFQGLLGAYSDLACRAVYPEATTLPCASFEEAFAAVHEGRAATAMIPVENSVAGRVADNHHLLPEGGLFIIGEHYQPVRHHLLALPNARMEDIKTVRSHIQGLMQCREWLKARNLTPVTSFDTAGSAQEVAAAGDKTVASIASELAGEIYGLQSLAADIADKKNNTTRFVILARETQIPKPRTPCVTTLVFRTRSVPAALYKALGGFATNGVNITKIESYLVDGTFDAAQFYVDVEGHPEETPLRLALEELRFFAQTVTLLGTYPAHIFRRQNQKL